MNPRREYHQKWYAENKDRLLKHQRERYAEFRNKFLDMYGRKCACCGNTLVEFLTIEHIKGQKGCKKSVGDKAYMYAVREFRPDLYQVLCMNCNHSLGRYGYCPHHPERSAQYTPAKRPVQIKEKRAIYISHTG